MLRETRRREEHGHGPALRSGLGTRGYACGPDAHGTHTPGRPRARASPLRAAAPSPVKWGPRRLRRGVCKARGTAPAAGTAIGPVTSPLGAQSSGGGATGPPPTARGTRTPEAGDEPHAHPKPGAAPLPRLLQGGAQQPDPQVPPCSPGPGIATAGQAGGGCRGSGDGPVAGVRPGLPPGLAVAPSRGVTREEAREEGAVAWESGGGLTPAPPHAGLRPHLEPQAGTARGCSRAGGKRCPLHGVPGHGQTLPLTASLLPARPGPLGLARRGHEGRATRGPRELESFLAAFPRS